MTDEELTSRFAALEPPQAVLSRVEARALASLDEPRPSLLDAWRELLGRRPFGGVALAAGASLALVVGSPAGLVLLAALRLLPAA